MFNFPHTTTFLNSLLIRTKILTCKLLFFRFEPHFFVCMSHLDTQSKKLQSLSLVQFCTNISCIFGSKKAMSTSIATTLKKYKGFVINQSSTSGTRYSQHLVKTLRGKILEASKVTKYCMCKIPCSYMSRICFKFSRGSECFWTQYFQNGHFQTIV